MKDGALGVGEVAPPLKKHSTNAMLEDDKETTKICYHIYFRTIPIPPTKNIGGWPQFLNSIPPKKMSKLFLIMFEYIEYK